MDLFDFTPEVSDVWNMESLAAPEMDMYSANMVSVSVESSGGKEDFQSFVDMAVGLNAASDPTEQQRWQEGPPEEQ